MDVCQVLKGAKVSRYNRQKGMAMEPKYKPKLDTNLFLGST